MKVRVWVAMTVLCAMTLPAAVGAASATEPREDEAQVVENVAEREDAAGSPADESPVVPMERPASAESRQPLVSVAWDASLASKYLFQGMDLSNGNPVIQPALALTSNNVTALAWANFDLDTQLVDEVDLYLQYGFELPMLSIAPGYAYFAYPNRGWDPTQELLVDVAAATPLNPSLSFHYDFDAGKGAYTTLGVGHELPVAMLPVAFGANLFYQSDYYGMTGIPALEINTSAGYTIGISTITASISYLPTWENGDFRGAAAVESSWLFSLNVAQSF